MTNSMLRESGRLRLRVRRFGGGGQPPLLLQRKDTGCGERVHPDRLGRHRRGRRQSEHGEEQAVSATSTTDGAGEAGPERRLVGTGRHGGQPAGRTTTERRAGAGERRDRHLGGTATTGPSRRRRRKRPRPRSRAAAAAQAKRIAAEKAAASAPADQLARCQLHEWRRIRWRKQRKRRQRWREQQRPRSLRSRTRGPGWCRSRGGRGEPSSACPMSGEASRPASASTVPGWCSGPGGRPASTCRAPRERSSPPPLRSASPIWSRATSSSTAPSGSDHVAMYIGGGMMIEAPETGEVVHITPLRLGGYGESFAGAGRP